MRTAQALGPLVALLAPLLAATAQAADTVRVALPIAVDVSYAPIFAAKDAGDYAKHNVTVEITAYRGAGAAVAALAAGAADVVNLVPSGVAVAVKKGVKIKIVGCGPQVTPAGWNMMVLSDSPYKSINDLAGKKIAVSSKNSTTDIYAQAAAQAAGVSIQTVPLGGSEWPALRSKQVDAMVRSPTQSLELISSGQVRSVVDFEEAIPGDIPECWAATEEIIKNKPDAIKGFVKATEESIERMQKDKPAALAFLKSYLDHPSDDFLNLSHTKIIMTLAKDSRVDMAALTKSLGIVKLGGITDLPPAADLVENFAIRR